jgi:biopolymer transport protein TolR
MSRRPMRGSARLADVEPDMNVTPLVDIVLVLLIIFMVVAPRMNQDIQVDLPGIFNPDPDIKGTMDPLKVAIPKAGEYYIDDQLYNLDAVAAYLSDRHAAEPLRKLVLRADANLRYGEVRDIMARAQEIGFPGLSFLVGKRHKAGEEATSDVAAKESAAAAPADTGVASGSTGSAPAETGAAPGNTGPAPENAGQGN